MKYKPSPNTFLLPTKPEICICIASAESSKSSAVRIPASLFLRRRAAGSGSLFYTSREKYGTILAVIPAPKLSKIKKSLTSRSKIVVLNMAGQNLTIDLWNRDNAITIQYQMFRFSVSELCQNYWQDNVIKRHQSEIGLIFPPFPSFYYNCADGITNMVAYEHTDY